MNLLGKPSKFLQCVTILSLTFSLLLFFKQLEYRYPKRDLTTTLGLAIHAGLLTPPIVEKIAGRFVKPGTSRQGVITYLQAQGFSFTPETGQPARDYSRLDAQWRKDDWLNTYPEIWATSSQVYPALCVLCSPYSVPLKLRFKNDALESISVGLIRYHGL